MLNSEARGGLNVTTKVVQGLKIDGQFRRRYCWLFRAYPGKLFRSTVQCMAVPVPSYHVWCVSV